MGNLLRLAPSNSSLSNLLCLWLKAMQSYIHTIITLTLSLNPVYDNHHHQMKKAGNELHFGYL